MKLRFIALLLICCLVFTTQIFADSDTDLLRKELQSLRDEMKDLKKEISELKSTKIRVPIKSSAATNTAAKIKPIKQSRSAIEETSSTTKPEMKDVATLSNAPDAKNSPANLLPPFSYQGRDITGTIVGGASTSFSRTAVDNSKGSFSAVDFNPIALFSYKDEFFLRTSVDFSFDDQGNTVTGLNYSNLNIILNDYLILGVGKFDSSLGFFGQNLSPAWINKMPDSPVGFSADQAAPQAEIGMKLLGGAPVFDKMKVNYSVFVANSNRAFADTTNLVIDHIGTDGYTKNFNDYLYGGRVGLLPIPEFEIGISAATGKIALIDMADNTTMLERGRNYSIIGADLGYRPGNWTFRGEYIQQWVASKSSSIISQSQKWKAWYLQAAYLIPSTKWEPVVRYSKFVTPISGQMQRQWGIGINYWFAPSISAQAAFESNTGPDSTAANHNSVLFQLAFGF